MERFETASLALIPGQRVRAKVLSSHPFGVIVEIDGHEDVGASVDIIQQFARTVAVPAELQALYPQVGSVIDAVVEEVRREQPPAWVRLSMRPEDLRSFSRPCEMCGEQTTLDADGDGVVLDVRGNGGPGGTTVLAHRTCLAAAVRPDIPGVRARILAVGTPPRPG